MTSITKKLNELRLLGMSRSWESLLETRQHQKLSLSGRPGNLTTRRKTKILEVGQYHRIIHLAVINYSCGVRRLVST